MKAIDRLVVIRYKSERKNKFTHKNLFRILEKDDIWIIAYENLQNKKEICATSNETPYKKNVKQLTKLREQVINEHYPFKRVNKNIGKQLTYCRRRLELELINNKIVQEIICLILEAIYESDFSEQSFGFQHKRGLHTAFKYIDRKFCWINWVLENKIKNTACKIDYKQLYIQLCVKIQDIRFLNLINKLLNSKILKKVDFDHLSFDVLQGNSLLKMLLNIYYNKLDKWVEKKIEKFYKDQIKNQKIIYNKLFGQIEKIVNQIKILDKKSITYKIFLKKLKFLEQKKYRISNCSKKSTKIVYVRYASKWIIGIQGKRNFANRLKENITRFLNKQFKQINCNLKLTIIHLISRKIKFLGYEIYISRNKKINSYKKSHFPTMYKIKPRLRFTISIQTILNQLEKRGYIKKLVKGYRALSKSNYTRLDDVIIIKNFRSVWLRLIHFYSGCTNLSKLQYIYSLLYMSCVMTLSHRHRSNIKKILRFFG